MDGSSSGSGGGIINIHDHGIVIENNRMQCNYCGKSVGSSFRLKCHVASVRGDVAPCSQVPFDLRKQMRSELITSRKRGKVDTDYLELCNPDISFNKKHCLPAAQSSGFQTGGREFKREIGRFFYETGLEFSVANSPSFRKMMGLTSGQPGLKIPSCEDLKGWLLEEQVREMKEYVETMRHSWGTTGCSILLDKWVDQKGRTLVNVLVNCPKGTIYLRSHEISCCVDENDAMYAIVEESIRDLGEDENVVQVIADFTSGWSNSVTDELRYEYNVFGVVSVTHCIGLILEKIGKFGDFGEVLDKAKVITKLIHGHESVLELLKKYTEGQGLIRPSKIESAMPFMTLDNIVAHKKNLEDMFSSCEWFVSTWALRPEGKKVARLIEDPVFWAGASTVLIAAMPFIHLLEWIFRFDKPLMGHIYEAMDQAKEKIREEFKRVKTNHMPFWNLIDDVWDNTLHSPLHAAGYYLNPNLFYASKYSCDVIDDDKDEVIRGLRYCLAQMVEHQPTKDLISSQLQLYKYGLGRFKVGKAINRRDIPPVEWWSRYGQDYPELQRFAIRILCQSCDGVSKYGLKRTRAENLLTEPRNPIEKRRVKDLTFLHYNLHLQHFCFGSGVKSSIVADEIDSTNDWIVDDATEILPQDVDWDWMLRNLDQTL